MRALPLGFQSGGWVGEAGRVCGFKAREMVEIEGVLGVPLAFREEPLPSERFHIRFGKTNKVNPVINLYPFIPTTLAKNLYWSLVNLCFHLNVSRAES